MQKPESIDLTHHISLSSRRRLANSLKGLYKYAAQPGMRQLAGGLPPPDYFPFDQVSAKALTPQSLSSNTSTWNWLKSFFTPATTEITIPKFAANPTDINSIQLSVGLQYASAQGLVPLANFVNEFSGKVYQPGYSNYETILNAGSTDAWDKICAMLADPGDGVLCEEWTYPNAMSTAWPHGIRPVPIPMDGRGINPDAFEEILATWDPFKNNGMKRPTLLYTIPVCQNPTGATLSADRKKKIYEVCVKFDVIIVEDDPYYFLQAGEYENKSGKSSQSLPSDDEFLASLTPSFLRFDHQGRVVRIDTFSKTIAPGSRLGWTTCNPVFAERLARASDASTQAASGFSQVLIGKLLVDEWGYHGYLDWLKGLHVQYKARRDRMVDKLVSGANASLRMGTLSNFPGHFVFFIPEELPMRDDKGFLLSEKSPDPVPILSFVPPQGGMFVWLRVHFSGHPSFGSLGQDATRILLHKLWIELAESKVLVVEGTIFKARLTGTNISNDDDLVEEAIQIDGDGFLRISFSTISEEDMKEAMVIFGSTVRKFWQKEIS